MNTCRVQDVDLNSKAVEVLLEGGRREETSRSSADKKDLFRRQRGQEDGQLAIVISETIYSFTHLAWEPPSRTA